MKVHCVDPARASLGEGALWDPARGVLWWVDIKAPALQAHVPATGVNHAQPLNFRVTALGHMQSGDLIACGDAGIVRLRVAADLTVHVAQVLGTPEEPAGNRFNDGKVDAAGRFWAGTMDDAEAVACGSLYRFDARGLIRIRGDIHVPNGPCFLEDGTLLTTDSAKRTIWALTLDAHGTPVGERVFATFGSHQGYPDGMTTDDQNHVWVAFWDGWCVRRLAPDGRIEREVPLPVQRPTSTCFAGKNLDRLYVTSATTGLDAAALAAQPHAGGLLMFEPGVRGRLPHRFIG
jgi:xylono-1,5-lactonase